jgi:hypothetical protein
MQPETTRTILTPAKVETLLMTALRPGHRGPALLDIATWMLAAIAVCSLALRQAWRRMPLTERWRKKRRPGH